MPYRRQREGGKMERCDVGDEGKGKKVKREECD